MEGLVPPPGCLGPLPFSGQSLKVWDSDVRLTDTTAPIMRKATFALGDSRRLSPLCFYSFLKVTQECLPRAFLPTPWPQSQPCMTPGSLAPCTCWAGTPCGHLLAPPVTPTFQVSYLEAIAERMLLNQIHILLLVSKLVSSLTSQTIRSFVSFSKL